MTRPYRRKTCVVCGNTFFTKWSTRTCGSECLRVLKAQTMRDVSFDHGRKVWTKDMITKSIQAFVERRGYIPSATDAMVKSRQHGMPALSTIILHFGSWNSAMREAGFEPRPRHKNDYDRTKARRKTVKVRCVACGKMIKAKSKKRKYCNFNCRERHYRSLKA